MIYKTKFHCYKYKDLVIILIEQCLLNFTVVILCFKIIKGRCMNQITISLKKFKTEIILMGGLKKLY